MSFNSYSRTASTPQNFLYNGKELQEETDWLDYGARMYQPDLGRWNAIDPLANIYYSASPYAYVLNQPISATDPDGMACAGCNNKDDEWMPSYVGEERPEPDKPIFNDLNRPTYIGSNSSSNGNGGNKPQNKPGVHGFGGSSSVGTTAGVTDIIAGGVSLYAMARASQFGGVAAKMPTVFLGPASGAHIFVENPQLIDGFNKAGLQQKSNSFLSRSMSFSKVASLAKWMGVGAAAIGTTYDIYQTARYYNNGGTGIARGTQTGMNAGAAAWGIFGGPIGWVGSASYFVMSNITEPDTPANRAKREVQMIMNRVKNGTSNPRRARGKIRNPKFEP